ncbi:MAG: hypothetical protein R3B95_20745 [Nitrospirales bacterium]|nr:hypothetical protein [Nitrospirales bacterium]
MNPRLVQSKLDTLTKDFEESLGVALWHEPPLMAFGDIARPVTDYDGLKARLASITALFDHFNKKNFDTVLGYRSPGTRSAFVAFLKLRFPDNQPAIESDIETSLKHMCLLRDYLLHTKNKNYRRALEYFGLSNPIDDPVLAWGRVLCSFAEWLDRVHNLIIESRQERYNNEALTNDPLQLLVDLTYARHRDLLESTPAGAMVNEIIRQGSVTDIELAVTFNIPVGDLRSLLYPLTGDILIVRPVDRYTTQLVVSEPMVEILQNSRIDSRDED